ncbi:MAG: hypothetical protein EOP49_24705 [Sphingobacteriales bacterium]|nr:MAG: hypothetical protein EOP49_24705 [Sphingobacteriales bacterium]
MLPKLLTACLLLLCPAAWAQQSLKEFDIRERSMYVPVPQKPGKYDHSLALAQIYLPDQWLEQSISAPMVEYRAKMALPKGFSLDGSLRTLIIANDIRLGPVWNHSLTEHLHVGVGYQIGFEYGFLREFGYNNTIRVWEHHPLARVGYSFQKVALTLQGRIDWMMGTRLGLQDYATSNITGSMFNGYSFGFFVEQRLTRKKSICFGFLANFNKFNILGWPALMNVDHQYFIPEINIGFNL